MNFKKVKHGYRVTETKIPKNINKSFAIATFIATVLRDLEPYPDAELKKLHLQSKRAMNVFYSKVGDYQYHTLLEKLSAIWKELADRNENTMKEESIPVLVECLAMIITPKDFREFFATKAYVRDRHIYFMDYKNIALGTLELDKELNKLLGTKSYGLIKPKEVVVKVKKPKNKKEKKRKEKTKPNRVIKKLVEKKERKKKNLSALADRIAKAKIKNKDER